MTKTATIPAMCLAALVTLTFTAPPVRAETPLHRPVEVNFDGVSIQNALATLGERAGVRFEYDAELMRGQYSVTYKAEGQEAGRIAMRILYPRGLELGEMRGDQVRIVKRDPHDEFKPSREEVYEFVRKPTLTREGDDVTISFETAGWCDVTIAIEDDRGAIIRHLASGVLGPNAPEPFVWNSRAQTVIWDGKNDKGEYVDDKDAVTVRVSLGLKPRFERTLFWHPGKSGGGTVAFAPAPEGVYVYKTGLFYDNVRLYDRDGSYLRTIYPFPADRVDSVPGLIRHRFPDGVELPIKPTYTQGTFLMTGRQCGETYRDGKYDGTGGGTYSPALTRRDVAWHDMAAIPGHLALEGRRLIRLHAGDGNDLNLHGAPLSYSDDGTEWAGHGDNPPISSLPPRRIALSPDARWLYLSMYCEIRAGGGSTRGWGVWRHMVMRVPFGQDDADPTIFAGSPEPGKETGQFNMPAGVACDAQGRVYVADHLNDRVQIFDETGRHLKSFDIRRPALVDVDPETGEIYVMSWALPKPGRYHYRPAFSSIDDGRPFDWGEGSTYFRLTKFSRFDEIKEEASWDLQQVSGLRLTSRGNVNVMAAVDTRSDPLRVWIHTPARDDRRYNRIGGGTGEWGPRVLKLEDGEWIRERDMLKEASRAISRAYPAAYNRQRLYVDHSTGMLYLGEGDSSEGKAFKELVRFDPSAGRIRMVDLPMSTEDMAFDLDGHAYLRSQGMIVRFRAADWREVPFDYGEERERIGYGSGSGTRSAHVQSGAVFPGNRGWHHGGMHVSAKGNIVVSALYSVEQRTRHDETVHDGEAYQPRIFPGRFYNFGGRFGGTLVHVINRHGQMVHDDAIPGLIATINGTAIDERGDIYLLHSAPRMIDGVRHFNVMAGTLMKFSPGQGRLLSARGAPVPLAERPERSMDLSSYGSRAWAEGAHWFYGGVGWGGMNPPTGCSCPNARFVLDYFARSFTPEHDRYNVGVVDSSGNLILRVGQYGNVDDGMPLVKDGGPPNPRSIGGDEVAIFDARYVATHTDRRLFIADSGNARIASVKLAYHTDETVPLKNVPDAGDLAN